LISAPRLRLAAALGASALLHAVALLAFRTPAPSPSTSEVQMNVLLLPLGRPAPPVPPAAAGAQPRPEQQKELGAKARPAAPPRPASAEPPEPNRRGAVSIAPVSAPRVPPVSQLADAASYLETGRGGVAPDLGELFVARYPRQALEQRRRAVVVFQLMIDESGRVVEALVLPGAAEDFVAAAREALGRARFTPAQAEGKAARSRAYFAVSFVIE
jgi:TonB family protein